MHKKITLRFKAILLTVAFLLFAGVGPAQTFQLESAGARFGVSANSTSEDFNQAEMFANFNVPWRWQFGSQWQLQTRIDFTAGWLGKHADNAGIFTAGPSLLLAYGHLPISLEGGSSPTLMTRDEFGATDLGSILQFSSHVGLNWDVVSHLRLSYRFQHMSNAGINSHNPGFNLHLFGVSYLF